MREPVQVYLDPEDLGRLERLRERLSTTKSDVLRRGLASLERELTDPGVHPALRIVGIGASGAGEGKAARDPARDHDVLVADDEERSWRRPGVVGFNVLPTSPLP